MKWQLEGGEISKHLAVIVRELDPSTFVPGQKQYQSIAWLGLQR